jgi:hypothetical protein
MLFNRCPEFDPRPFKNSTFSRCIFTKSFEIQCFIFSLMFRKLSEEQITFKWLRFENLLKIVHWKIKNILTLVFELACIRIQTWVFVSIMVFWLVAPCVLQPWRWRQNVSPKLCYPPTSPHGTKPQINMRAFSAVRTLNLVNSGAENSTSYRLLNFCLVSSLTDWGLVVGPVSSRHIKLVCYEFLFQAISFKSGVSLRTGISWLRKGFSAASVKTAMKSRVS